VIAAPGSSPITVPAVGLLEFGGPDVLRIMDVPISEPTGRRVRVRVRSAAVNPTDALLRMGQILPMPAEGGLVPGMDFAGVVTAVGDSSTQRVGDTVMGVTMPTESPAAGAYASEIVVDERNVIALPRDVDFPAAATLLMNGLTALHALDGIDLPPGSTIGVTGGAGVLGGFVIQLAVVRGLRVVADGFPADVPTLAEKGADIVIDRGDATAARMVDAVGRRVDAIVDAARIGSETLASAVRDDGWLVMVRPGEAVQERGIRTLLALCVEYFGNRSKMEYLRHCVEAGAVTPPLARTLSVFHATDAHHLMEAGGQRGRLVLEWHD
jgi:NADPH2:quinone reductase